MIKKEKFLENSVDSIFINQAETIICQMKKCVCKIISKNNARFTGFFCKIPYPDKAHLLPVLATTDFAIEPDIKEGNIKISIDNDKEFKEINLINRKIFKNRELYTCFIELIPEDKINDFLEIDENIFKENQELSYIKNSIYVLHYIKGENVAMNPGILKKINKNNFEHLCNTKDGSSGGPILLLKTCKVIGIHWGSSNHLNFNFGTLIKYSIEEFIKNNVGK